MVTNDMLADDLHCVKTASRGVRLSDLEEEASARQTVYSPDPSCSSSLPLLRVM